MSAGETIRDVILRITGDGDDARRELERLALDLTKFGQKHAEADAEIDTAKAKADLKALETQFSRIDGRDLTATAKVRLGKAMAELTALQAKVDELDNRDIEIDVDVKKDLADRLQGLGGDAAHFADKLGDVERRSKGAGEAIADTNVNFFNMNTRMGSLLKILPVLLPMLGGFVAQIVAMGASAIQAIGGLGALAIAMGGALVAAVAIGVAAFVRFKETMETAGTPAFRIVQIVGKIGEALSGLSKAADPILHAIADNLGGVFGVIERVTPAFFELGKTAGKAIGWMLKALTSDSMAASIAKLLELAGPVMMPLVKILVRFGKVLLGIANAAMPFLTSALQGLAKWLGEAARGVDHLTRTREAIGGMIDHLKSWWNLLVQITGVFGELVRIAAPFGKAMVDTLAEGAEKLKEWLSSKEGTERVQQFFKDVLPLASEVAKTIGRLVVIFLQFAQLLAPVIKPMLAGYNQLLTVVNVLLELLLKIPASVRAMIGVIGVLAAGFGKVKVAGEAAKAAFLLLSGSMGVLGGAFSGLWNVVKSVIGAIPGYVRDKLSQTRDDVVAFSGLIRDGAVVAWNAIRDAAGAIWGAIKDRIAERMQEARETVGNISRGMRDVAVAVWHGIREAAAKIFQAAREAIVNALQSARESVANNVRSMREAAVNVWHGIREAAANIFQAIREAITNALQSAREGVGNAVRGMSDVARSVWQGIREAAASIFQGVRDAIVTALGAAREAVGNIVEQMLGVVKGMTGAFYNAGKALIESMIDGFLSLADSLYDKIKGVADKATSLLPGSEPRDKTSPFVNLKHRGAAIIRNLMEGIDQAGPELVKALSNQLSNAAAAGPPGLAIAGDTSGTSPALSRSGVLAAGATVGGSGTTIDKLIVQPLVGGGPPDPHVLAAQLEMLLRVRGG